MDTRLYFSPDTIAAPITGSGGAVSVVRLSGSRCVSVLRLLVDSSQLAAGTDPEPRRAVFSTLKHGGKILDEALWTYFKAPQSFTGEDVIEFGLHGSPAVVARFFDVLTELGVRHALPGEFSFRAVQNGKLSLPEAEATADLIASQTEESVELALEKMSGTQAAALTGLAEDLRKLAMLSEAGIDFGDQDIAELSLDRLKERVRPAAATLKGLAETFSRGRLIQEGVRVAFVGEPNAGKSSLFNALLGEDRSIVTEFAGTTRDVVREQLRLQGTRGGVVLRVADTAGVRDASDQVERLGVERTHRAIKEAELWVWVVDGEKRESPEFLKTFDPGSQKLVLVINKSDLLTKEARAAAEAWALLQAEPYGGRVILTSAKTGAGVSELAAGLAHAAEAMTTRKKGELLLTRAEHRERVLMTVSHLERALESDAEDLFAADLRQALMALAPLIGETPPDEILGRIFSQFCIGK